MAAAPCSADCLEPYKVSPYFHYAEVAVRAALEAGALVADAFSRPKQVTAKQGPADLVTETDKASEATVLGIIREAFPTHRFIGEEGSAEDGGVSALTDEPTWMVDPLDGTTNFVHSFPMVCISIGLAIGREPRVGVVYNPVTREMFTAVHGGGAHLNGSRLATSGEARLAAALVASELGIGRDAATVDAVFNRIRAVAGAARALRCCGSCALNLCNVAAGRADAFFEIGFGGCWDAAAGALVVLEAGGAVCDPAGGSFDVMGRRVLAAASQELAASIASILEGCALGPNEPGPPSAPAAPKPGPQ